MLSLYRVQQLLRLSYAHVQMMLYRPFLHYVSKRACAGKTVDDRSYACAAACVSVSRNVVHITAEMKRRGLLIGAYWFTMYTTFFAILSLVFFVLENPDKPGSQEILADATGGREALAGLAKRSMAADRCTAALEVSLFVPSPSISFSYMPNHSQGLFEQLPERLKSGRVAAVTTKKKRSAPGPNPSPMSKGIRSSPDINHSPSKGPQITPAQRALTFPVTSSSSVSADQRQSMTFDPNGFQPQPRVSDPNLRHSYHELTSPTQLSSTGTPDSAQSNNSISRFQIQQQFGNNSNLPDLSAMMFPSADPFAYPNQPMMEYESLQQKGSEQFMIDDRAQQAMFMPNGNTTPYDNLEGQLFGPLPPYLLQTQTNIDMANQMEIGMGGMGLNPGDMNMGSVHTGMTPNTGINYEDIFGNGSDSWDAMVTDTGYRQ
jgi:hypothetical protein